MSVDEVRTGWKSIVETHPWYHQSKGTEDPTCRIMQMSFSCNINTIHTGIFNADLLAKHDFKEKVHA